MIEGDELEALVESVRDHGLAEPIWLDADGVLLDGRNRLAACKQAGVTPTFQVYHGADVVDFIVRLNVHRRHLTTGQKAMAATDLLPIYEVEAKARQAHGLTAPGQTLGAGLPQASTRAPRARDRAAAALGTSGKAVAQAKRVTEKAPDLADKVRAGTVALDTAERLVKIAEKLGDDAAPIITEYLKSQKPSIEKAEKAGRAAKAKRDYLTRQAAWDSEANTAGDLWEMRHGDFRQVLADIEPGTVDAIITDPPYPDEFLPLWADLADLAAKLLRPGAPLIAWSGQYRFPQVLNHLCGPLTYQWTICLDLPGSNARFRTTNFIQTWKPIIVCSAGKWGPHDWHRDRVVSPSKDQDLYEWQQNPDPAAELIARYVPEGGLVLDPFTGVGSFGAAALTSGRRFIGVEQDEGRYIESRQRLTGMGFQ
jgi:ParB-like chromosome segregation protein Spo0J